MAELCDIFRAPNGDEFHFILLIGRMTFLLKGLPFRIEIDERKCLARIEGPYRVWQEK
jgi:hypothetical protein